MFLKSRFLKIKKMPSCWPKRPISNNNDRNNIPAKVLHCQYPVKTVPDVEVNKVILNSVDQEHKNSRKLAILEKLASTAKRL